METYTKYKVHEETGFELPVMESLNAEDLKKYTVEMKEIDPTDEESFTGDEKYVAILTQLATDAGIFNQGTNLTVIVDDASSTVLAGVIIKPDGKINVRIRIRYCDGSETADIILSRSDIKVAGEGNCGIPDVDNTVDKDAYAISMKFRSMIDEYERPGVHLDSDLILMRIYTYFDRLKPIRTTLAPFNIMNVYAYCVEWAIENSWRKHKSYIDGVSVYRFLTEDIIEIALNFMVTKEEIIKILDDHGCLYYKPNKASKQVKVRDVGYCYYLRKITLKQNTVSINEEQTNSKIENDTVSEIDSHEPEFVGQKNIKSIYVMSNVPVSK